uniref:Uncharacterized protein n=1 Tax=mine drainage metagenome TaxID=410659 RepID=E6Q2R7_9ZZZZ
MKSSFALAALIAASALAGCSSGGSAFSPLAAGAVAPSTPVPTSTPTPGPLTASPAAIAIGATNPSTASFAATETWYDTFFRESDTCAGIATVESTGITHIIASGPGAPPNETTERYLVTQIGAGTCAATITDDHGGSVSVPIVSSVYGSLKASTTSIALGNGAPTVTSDVISESGYAGAFSESDTCAGIATVTLSPANGPNATLSVAQVAAGTCAVQVSDNHAGSISVSVISTTSTVIIDTYDGGSK